MNPKPKQISVGDVFYYHRLGLVEIVEIHRDEFAVDVKDANDNHYRVSGLDWHGLYNLISRTTNENRSE